MKFANQISVVLTKKSCATYGLPNSYTVVLEVLGKSTTAAFSVQKNHDTGNELLIQGKYPLLDKSDCFTITVSVFSGNSPINSSAFFSNSFLTDPCNFDTEIFLPIKDPKSKKSAFYLTIDVKLLD